MIRNSNHSLLHSGIPSLPILVGGSLTLDRFHILGVPGIWMACFSGFWLFAVADSDTDRDGKAVC